MQQKFGFHQILCHADGLRGPITTSSDRFYLELWSSIGWWLYFTIKDSLWVFAFCFFTSSKLSSDSFIILFTSKLWVCSSRDKTQCALLMLLNFYVSPIHIASNDCPIKTMHRNPLGFGQSFQNMLNSFQLVFIWSLYPVPKF